MVWNDCEKCGYSKKVHKQENYHFVFFDVEVQENTNEQHNNLKNVLSEQGKKINERINQQNNGKDSL